jgi:hypothetical protein
MKSRPQKSTVAALAAVAGLALPAVASGATDYSKNAATGNYTAAETQDEEIYVNPSTGLASGQKNYSQNGATGAYAHGPLPPPEPVKDYSKNAANGTYAPEETPSVEAVPVADDDGFAWGDAAIGAGVALALALIALGATTAVRRRRIASPAV